MRLKDKVVIVTGSTTGIGEAIARRVAREGGRVLIHGRDEAKGEKVRASIGEAAASHYDDLSDPDAAGRIVAAALDAFGKIDALVNNAAVVNRSDIRSSDVNFFDWMMSINLRAPMLLIQAALDELAKTKGAILNIGSINAWCGQPDLLVYSMTKGALMTLTRNLGNVLNPDLGVRINQFNVGWVFTANEDKLKQAEGLPPGWQDELPKAFAPTGTILRPHHIAEAAVYWIGDESRPICGQVFEVEQYPLLGRFKPGD